MNAFEIYLNYNAACGQAKELDNIARKLRNNAEHYLNESSRHLDGKWNGDASKEFISKEKQLIDKMTAEADSLQQVAETIRRIARRTYETEMKALELSQKRTYS